MVDIREEARAEAERQHALGELYALEIDTFIEGAVWADARKVEATEALADVRAEYGRVRAERLMARELWVAMGLDSADFESYCERVGPATWSALLAEVRDRVRKVEVTEPTDALARAALVAALGGEQS